MDYEESTMEELFGIPAGCDCMSILPSRLSVNGSLRFAKIAYVR